MKKAILVYPRYRNGNIRCPIDSTNIRLSDCKIVYTDLTEDEAYSRYDAIYDTLVMVEEHHNYDVEVYPMQSYENIKNRG